MQSSNSNLAIDLTHVRKVYRRRILALDGVSIRVRRGEVFGLLGPNGAGKSTLVKIMMTVVRPSKASGTMLGQPLGHKPTLARVGYLPENHRFPRYLTGKQVLEFYAAMAGIDRRTRKRRTGELLETVGMTDRANDRITGYSKGMMQRVGLAQAMVNDPELILLDEPTDGVDPVGRRDIRDCLLRLREQGTTIFINSHLLSELELVCDRVAILIAGQVARQGTMDELTISHQHYRITLDGEAEVGEALAAMVSAEGFSVVGDGAGRRAKLRCGASLEWVGRTLHVGTIEPETIQPLIDALRRRNIVISALQVIRPSLEDLFMDTVRDQADSVQNGPARTKQGAQTTDINGAAQR